MRSAFDGARRLRFFDITSPAFENRHSLGTDVAGIVSRRRTGRVGGSNVDTDHGPRYLEGRALMLRTMASSSLLRGRWLPPHAGDGRRSRMVLEGAGGVLSRQDAARCAVRSAWTRAAPNTRHVGPFYGASVYSCIAVVCKITYGSFIPQSTCGSYRIVSRYFV